jgi:hypothetical protein
MSDIGVFRIGRILLGKGGSILLWGHCGSLIGCPIGAESVANFVERSANTFGIEDCRVYSHNELLRICNTNIVESTDYIGLSLEILNFRRSCSMTSCNACDFASLEGAESPF